MAARIHCCREEAMRFLESRDRICSHYFTISLIMPDREKKKALLKLQKALKSVLRSSDSTSKHRLQEACPTREVGTLEDNSHKAMVSLLKKTER